MSRIVRYISNKKFERFKNDIAFLINKIRDSEGELDLQLRDDYFNIYYKGNSLAKVHVREKDYEVLIHNKFKMSEAIGRDPKKRFEGRKINKTKEYDSIIIESNLLHPLFQDKVIKSLVSEIKEVNAGEEIAFEQSLMTDNHGRKELIVIDRQVQGGGILGKLDLLALEETENGNYKFVVLEVKLGNNTELSNKVAGQLKRYTEAIKANIQEFRECYELNYAQKKELGLFPDDFPKTISISDEVGGKIVVGFYSRIGKKQTEALVKTYPELQGNVIHFINKIEI